MRFAIIGVTITLFVAGCATPTAPNLVRTYDHRTNTTSYKPAGAASEPAAKPVPHWYRFGHP